VSAPEAVQARFRCPQEGGDLLLFSNQDVELVKLLRWCRCISRNDLQNIFPNHVQANLEQLGLIKLYGSDGIFLLATIGNSFLEGICPSLPPAIPFSYKRTDTVRRLRVSKFVLTAYQAGFDIFTTSLSALNENHTLFLPTIMRAKGSNVWGNSRVAALVRAGELLCAVHYVCPDIGTLLLSDELQAFSNNTARILDVQRAFIFVGESYGQILSELERPLAEPDVKTIYYADFYHRLELPVYLLPCNNTGAIQLRLMSVPQYRLRLTQAALNGRYVSPPKEAAVCWDAVFNEMPFVMAVDMDMRRIDAAVKLAHRFGYPQIAIAALQGQVESFLSRYFRGSGSVRLFILNEETLTHALGEPPALYTPPPTQYLTPKGAVVDAPIIQTHRKAGRSSRR
jgi:hypothetical protein